MESRSSIGYLKKTIEQIRRERAMQREGLRGDDEEGGLGGGAAAASEENDAEEKEHMKVRRQTFFISRDNRVKGVCEQIDPPLLLKFSLALNSRVSINTSLPKEYSYPSHLASLTISLFNYLSLCPCPSLCLSVCLSLSLFVGLFVQSMEREKATYSSACNQLREEKAAIEHIQKIMGAVR